MLKSSILEKKVIALNSLADIEEYDYLKTNK